MIIAVDEFLPQTVSELICIRCGAKYKGLYRENTQLKGLDCRKCGEKQYLIKTGVSNVNSL